MSTEWMATAYETLTRKYPGYRDRWISDDKWLEIIRNNYIDNPSKEKEEELKFSRGNMGRAIGSKGKSADKKTSRQATKVAYSATGTLSLLK
jgi:hypothetical protein